jgi:Tol biopolymer transport system component
VASRSPLARIRESPAIDGRTVAWVDYTADPAHPQIAVEKLDTQQVSALTQDTTMQNLEPSVSPDGSVVTWAKCAGSFSGCDVRDSAPSPRPWRPAPPGPLLGPDPRR